MAVAMAATPAMADGPFGLQLEGSFGDGGFSKYRPNITNPIFNESPFITTEVRPIYVYHNIPDDFITDGGSVNVAAVQARLAVTDRLGIIATTDGYSWLNFDNVLPDTDGWNDITVGVKYAVISDPEAGVIVTPGLRYTIPVGNIDTAGLDLNGHAGGYLNPFISAAYLFDKVQLQGMVGANISLTDDGTSMFLASLHADYEVFPGFYPMVEMNLFAPIDGGDQLRGPVLGNLTGADLFDLASDDPETILTLGGGFRYAFTDNVMFGVGADVNVLQDENHVYGWRILTDLVVHF
jgi:hypothetical protein